MSGVTARTLSLLRPLSVLTDRIAVLRPSATISELCSQWEIQISAHSPLFSAIEPQGETDLMDGAQKVEHIFWN